MNWAIACGNSRDLLEAVPENSVDALVTDPPAGIGFMNREWDSMSRGDFIALLTGVFYSSLQALKPGAHALVWAIPRTSHVTVNCLEGAGFEIRDVIHHLYGQGMPKSKNLGDGMGTALKPACEHWILARKPVVGSITATFAAHGTGGMNINGCRVSRASDDVPGWHQTGADGSAGYLGEKGAFNIRAISADEIQARCGDKGRWPPNLLLSHLPECCPAGTARVRANGSLTGTEPSPKTAATYSAFVERSAFRAHGEGDGKETVTVWECEPGCPVAALDEQSGVRKGGTYPAFRSGMGFHGGNGTRGERVVLPDGGASRYFPCFGYFPKPTRAEREAGCEQLADSTLNRVNPGGLEHEPRFAPIQVKNNHPTVKGIALMRWLVRLITPPGGLILDPFAGSGTTGCAAVLEGCRFLGFEQDASYCRIAEERIAHWHAIASGKSGTDK